MSPRGSTTPRPNSGAGAGAMLVILGAAAAGSAVFVWMAGGIAGLLGGGQPVFVPLSDAPSVLARLPRHLDDPAAAWPAADRSALPDVTVLLAAIAVAAIAVLAALVLVVVLVGRVRGSAAAGQERSATWARGRDLRSLRVRRPERGRVILGRHERHLIAAEPRASTMVIAPAQSGKTSGLAIPAILEWDGPVLATSVKADLAHDTYAARSRQGSVRVFDPTGVTGLPGAAWSPVAAATTWEGARRTAARLLQVGQHSGRSSDDAFWRPAGARYLAPLLLAAAQERVGMLEVLSWINTTEQERPCTALEDADVDGAQAALEALRSVWEADDRFRSSVQHTLATALDAWQEPRVAAATSATGAIDADWLLTGRNTLYLTAPADDQRRLSGLFTALVADVVATAFARSAGTGRPIDPPLLLCLDELANVAPLPNLDEIAATAPGQGVQLLSIFQNLSQVADRWGRDRAETIIANHRARVFGSGIADRATLDYLGAVLGEEEIDRVSTHRQRFEIDLGSRTYSHDFKRLGSPNRIREAAANTALLVYGHLPPAWLTLRPWYRDRALRREVEAPVPAPAPADSAATTGATA